MECTATCNVECNVACNVGCTVQCTVGCTTMCDVVPFHVNLRCVVYLVTHTHPATIQMRTLKTEVGNVSMGPGCTVQCTVGCTTMCDVVPFHVNLICVVYLVTQIGPILGQPFILGS